MSASYPGPTPGQDPSATQPQYPPSYPPPQYPPPQYGQSMAPGYGPPPTGYPPYGYAPPPARTVCTAAIVSFAFGIGAWLILPFIAAIVAVIAGHMARGEIRDSQGRLDGEGFAVAGMVLGYIQLALAAFVTLLVVLFIIGSSST
jgi:Domain of unknown function (DUF4190)